MAITINFCFLLYDYVFYCNYYNSVPVLSNYFYVLDSKTNINVTLTTKFLVSLFLSLTICCFVRLSSACFQMCVVLTVRFLDGFNMYPVAVTVVMISRNNLKIVPVQTFFLTFQKRLSSTHAVVPVLHTVAVTSKAIKNKI